MRLWPRTPTFVLSDPDRVRACRQYHTHVFDAPWRSLSPYTDPTDGSEYHYGLMFGADRIMDALDATPLRRTRRWGLFPYTHPSLRHMAPADRAYLLTQSPIGVLHPRMHAIFHTTATTYPSSPYDHGVYAATARLMHLMGYRHPNHP